MTMATERKDLFEILQNCSGIEINKIRKRFTDLDAKSWESLLQKLERQKDADTTILFVYYLLIFSEEPGIRESLRGIQISRKTMAFLFSCLRESISDQYKLYEAIRKTGSLISQEALLKLVLNTEIIKTDSFAKYSLTSLLDTKHLDILFNSLEDVNAFLKDLKEIPEDIQKIMFADNQALCGFVSLFIQTSCDEGLTSEAARLKRERTDYSSLDEFTEEINSSYDIAGDQRKRLPLRNNKRIVHIVRTVKKLGYTREILSRMKSDGIIIDDEEISLIEEILHNPLLKSIAS